MALDMYMKVFEESKSVNNALDGIWPIGGEGLIAPTSKLFKIGGFSHHVATQISPGRPSQFKSGVRQSYCNHDTVGVTRRMDNASPKLFGYCVNNKQLAGIQLFVCQIEMNKKGEAKPTSIFELRMTGVLIADYAYQNGDDYLAESFSVHYDTIEMDFRPYDFKEEKYEGQILRPAYDRGANKFEENGIIKGGLPDHPAFSD